MGVREARFYVPAGVDEPLALVSSSPPSDSGWARSLPFGLDREGAGATPPVKSV